MKFIIVEIVPLNCFDEHMQKGDTKLNLYSIMFLYKAFYTLYKVVCCTR